MIKLILSDLDNTLIWGDPRVATQRTREAIHAALDAGVHFAPATGRVPGSLPKLFAGDAACYATLLANNGQTIFVDGERVFDYPLDRDALTRAAEVLADAPDAWLVLDFFDEGEQCLVGGPLEIAEKNRPYFWNVTRSVDEVPDRQVLKANVRVIGDFDRGRVVRKALVEACPELDFVFPMQERPHIDIVPHGWGKGSGGLWLARRLCLSEGEVCCFGDAENDLEMFSHVTNSVAVANAQPPVARSARWHVGRADEGAVGDAILDIARATTAGEMPQFMRDR